MMMSIAYSRLLRQEAAKARQQSKTAADKASAASQLSAQPKAQKAR